MYWQGDDNAPRFLALWYETLRQLKNRPSDSFIYEVFERQCRKSIMLRRTFEEIDLSEEGSEKRTYEYLLDRLQHLVRVNQNRANKTSVSNPGGSAPGKAAAGADNKKVPKGAPKGDPKGKGKGDNQPKKDVCYKWNYGICSDPCPAGRIHRKLQTDDERTEFKRLKEVWDKQAAAKKAAEKAEKEHWKAWTDPPYAVDVPKSEGGAGKEVGKAKGKGKDKGKGKGKRGSSPSPPRSKSPTPKSEILCRAEKVKFGSCPWGASCEFCHDKKRIEEWRKRNQKQAPAAQAAAPTEGSASAAFERRSSNGFCFTVC